MYQISFPAQLNQVSWTFVGSVSDANTNDLLDLSIYDWTFEVLDQNTDCVLLSATTGKGNFTIPELGIFQFYFSRGEMGRLCPGTYPTRMWMSLDDQSTSLSVGPLPVVDR